MPELRYTPGPGDGVLIAAGSSFVVVRGPVDVDQVDRIWAALREGRSLAGLLDVVTRGRLGDLPDFVVAVLDGASGGLHVIQRPGLDVITTDSDRSVQVHSAAGSAVWFEHTTNATSSVLVDLTGASGEPKSLPLESGAVAAAVVSWSPNEPLGANAVAPASIRQAVTRRDDESAGNDGGLAGLVAEPASAVGVADRHTEVGGYTILGEDLIDDGPEIGEPEPGASGGGAVVSDAPERAADPYDSLFGATMYRSVESAAVRQESEQSRGIDPLAESEPVDMPGPVISSPLVAPLPSAPTAPTLPTAMIDSVPVMGVVSAAAPVDKQLPPGDHDGYTVTAASLRELRLSVDAASAVAPTASATPVVHAIACASGHPNPPQSGTCRVCGNPLPFQDPITVPRPPLGVLVFAGGREVILDRLVLIGRSPAVERVAPGDLPHLVKLDSPTKDLSRNHVEVRLEGWHVLVVDLQSTNGTVVQLPGRPPERVHPLEPYAIVPGTVITMGDEQSFVYEVRG